MGNFVNAVTLQTGSAINGAFNIGASTAATLTLDGTGTQTYSSAVTGTTTLPARSSNPAPAPGRWTNPSPTPAAQRSAPARSDGQGLRQTLIFGAAFRAVLTFDGGTPAMGRELQPLRTTAVSIYGWKPATAPLEHPYGF